MAASETCSVCGEEVRWGWRHGREAYWHRSDVDHAPIFGQQVTPEMFAEIERQMDLPREREIPCDPPFPLIYRIETYTAREYDEERFMRNKKYREAREAQADPDDEEEGHELEPIEVYSTPMPHKGSLLVETPYGTREVKVPGGVRTILNLAAKQGWEVTRLTYSRGPYVGASGKSLGVSDLIVLHVRGPVVDGDRLTGVASWRDGKSDSVWLVEKKTLTKIGAKALIARMKEAPSG